MSKLLKKYPLMDYLFIAMGSFVMAVGIGVFLVDAKVVPGGASGLAMAIHYVSGNKIPVGISLWMINVPLFIWGFRELGKRFGVRTFFGFTLNSIFIDLVRGDMLGLGIGYPLQNIQAVRDLYQNDFLFLILIGATLLGVGLGIIFKFRGTTAGSDIVAAILQKRKGLKPGQAIMIIDFFVIAFAGVIIEAKGLSEARPALSLTLYAFFLLFVSSKLIDVIIDGFDYARQALIISEKNKEIADAIMENLSRGCTAFKTRGLYKNIDRDVILTVVTVRELSKLEHIIKKIDEDAFVIINNIHEVQGKGFRRRI